MIWKTAEVAKCGAKDGVLPALASKGATNNGHHIFRTLSDNPPVPWISRPFFCQDFDEEVEVAQAMKVLNRLVLGNSLRV